MFKHWMCVYSEKYLRSTILNHFTRNWTDFKKQMDEKEQIRKANYFLSNKYIDTWLNIFEIGTKYFHQFSSNTMK